MTIEQVPRQTTLAVFGRPSPPLAAFRLAPRGTNPCGSARLARNDDCSPEHAADDV